MAEFPPVKMDRFFPKIRAHNGEIDETTPPKTPKGYGVLVLFAEKLQSVRILLSRFYWIHLLPTLSVHQMDSTI